MPHIVPKSNLLRRSKNLGLVDEIYNIAEFQFCVWSARWLTPITKTVILTRYSTDQNALVFSNTPKPGKISEKSLSPYPSTNPDRPIYRKWGGQNNFFLSRSPLIQCFSYLLVDHSGVLDGIGRVGVSELPLNRGDIAGFLYDEGIREQVEDIAVKRNQRPPAELEVWGRPLEGAGATLCWWSLICKFN